MQLMITTSLVAVGASLFPFLPHALGLDGPRLWQLCSGALVVFYVLLTLQSIRQFRRYERAGIVRRNSSFFRLGAALVVLAVAAIGCNAVGWPVAPGAGLYIFALYVPLLMAALFFLRIFVSFVPPSTD